MQKQGESVADYVAELRRLSEHCAFSDLNAMLRDQLVCGVHNSRTQKTLGRICSHIQEGFRIDASSRNS